ncbi:hypothetical protein [Streptomyces sp. CoT10]|uniref:hypothetical protein n=1 Tax=Streptomyces sp. CoT10 TaxID=2875762 RepID=UPI001CD58039|nr:hypothetical protein [Streptomyces sp. CoT10]
MNRFDLGVFVDAHHLLEAAPRGRRASDVIARIEAAAEEQCMSFGIANRLVVADCADAEARAIAEDFDAQGFVIRHVPARSALTRAHVLTAEIIEATAVREELRTVAVVAEEGVPLSVADKLHRAGRALIACVAGATRDSAALDRLLTLALDSGPLRSFVTKAANSLRAAGRSDVRIPEFESALRRVRPGFVSAAYGTTTKQMLRQLSGTGFRFVEPDRILITPQVSTAGAERATTGTELRPDAVTDGVVPGPRGLLGAMADAAAALPAITTVDTDSVVKALRSVLDLAAERAHLREAAVGRGLTIQEVCAGLAVVANRYRSSPCKPLELCQIAVDGTPWKVLRNPDKPEDIRLRLSEDSVPGGT